ncbi:Uma2 family endonuclease [Nonomuraea sp. NPDC051941]|uniref:Uma2 family endonuclease n=1 Tax=Nonomuraea sp. NPDC051941 TaxID=3364373 RepID=UPI0037C9F54A
MATIEPTGTGRAVIPGRAPFTVDDLLELPDDGNRYELFNGSLLVSPAPTVLHQIAITYGLLLLKHAAPPQMEVLTTVNLKATNQDVYIPDLVVVPKKRSRTTGLMFSPQDVLLAVEVGSPSTKMRDKVLKAEAYGDAGIPVYWRIEPEEGPTLWVYELKDECYDTPVRYKAGTLASFTWPFPVSFDPAELLGD